MTNSTLFRLDSLDTIIKKYKNEIEAPMTKTDVLFHIHKKNPDAKHQIKLLETAQEYIKLHIKKEEWNKAQLGFLFILKALFSEPNRNGKIFSYIIEKIELNAEIKKLLNRINSNIEIDLTDSTYLKIMKKEIKFSESIINSHGFKVDFHKKFIRDLMGTIATEIDYVDKVLKTIEVSNKL